MRKALDAYHAVANVGDDAVLIDCRFVFEGADAFFERLTDVLRAAVERFLFASRELDVLRGDLRAGNAVGDEQMLRLLDAVGDARVIDLSIDDGEKTADQRFILLDLEGDLLAEQLVEVPLDGCNLFFAERAGCV